MKFYDCETAPSPRRVRIFIAEKNIDIETVQVDLRSGEQFSDEFRAINPDCVVPVLELDDGTCISEVLAICHYLEERYPEPNLLGSTPEEKARVLMWNSKVELQGLLAIAEAFRNSAKGFKDRATTGPVNYTQLPELAERGRSRLKQFFRRIDEQLGKTEYLAGKNFSVADIGALVTADVAGWIKVEIPDDAANVRRWYEQVSGRPGAVT